MAADVPTLPRWRCCRFDELSGFELDAIYRARQLVFAVGPPYLEDGIAHTGMLRPPRPLR